MDPQFLQMGLCLIDITHYIFNYTCILGWSTSTLYRVRLLFQTWWMLLEDLFGPNGQPLELVAGVGHLFDNVEHFGHSDVYWCYPYEREVKTYQNIHSNDKQVEETFIKFYA